MNSSSKADKSVFFVEEIWQTQRWFPILGWDVAARAQYSTPKNRVFDELPGDEILPEGWCWMNEWSVDKSKMFGDVDADGWAYGASVDSIIEAFSNGNSKGEMMALSVVRRRHLTRSRICVSFSLRESIESKIARLIELSAALQSELASKNASLLALKDYEKARQPITRIGYYKVNDEAQRYLLAYKDFVQRLEAMHEYLVEKSSVERAYAHRMKKMAARLQHLAALSSSSSTSSQRYAGNRGTLQEDEKEPSSISGDLLAGLKLGKNLLKEVVFGGNDMENKSRSDERTPDSSQSIADPMNVSPLPPPAEVDSFFDKIGSVHDKMSSELMTVPGYLDSELRSEVKKCLDDFLIIFSGNRDEWKVLRDAYRQAEEDAKKAFCCAEICHQYSCAATVSELSKVAAAIEAAKTGAGVPSDIELRPSGADARKDIWIELQRYYRALGQIRLSIINFSHFVTRLRGLYDKLRIRIKSVFMVVTHHVVDSQRRAWLNCTDILKDVGDQIDGLASIPFSNSSSEARLDPTTVEVLLQYYSNDSEDPEKNLIEYSNLPPVVSNTCPVLVGVLLMITTSHAESPEYYQVFGGMSEISNDANTCRATKPTWALNKVVLTVDGYLHIYSDTSKKPETLAEAKEKSIYILEDFDIPEEEPFLSIDVRQTKVFPIHIPPEYVFLTENDAENSSIDISSTSINELEDIMQSSSLAEDRIDAPASIEVAKARVLPNGFYICRHRKQCKRSEYMGSDFCLWTFGRDSYLKWSSAFKDPLSVKTSHAGPVIVPSYLAAKAKTSVKSGTMNFVYDTYTKQESSNEGREICNATNSPTSYKPETEHSVPGTDPNDVLSRKLFLKNSQGVLSYEQALLKQKERESQKISEVSVRERDLRNGGILSPERIGESGRKVKSLSMRFDSRNSSEDADDDRSSATASLDADIQRIILLAQKFNYPGIHSVLNTEGSTISIEATDTNGNNLLHFASQLGNDELVRLVVKCGINLDARNNDGRTALHLAFAFGHDGLGEYLTEQGADDTLVDDESLSCYDIAGTSVL